MKSEESGEGENSNYNNMQLLKHGSVQNARKHKGDWPEGVRQGASEGS